jgi:hypothetical protein
MYFLPQPGNPALSPANESGGHGVPLDPVGFMLFCQGIPAPRLTATLNLEGDGLWAAMGYLRGKLQ